MLRSFPLYLTLALFPIEAFAVGFERISTDTTRSITVGVWYPSSSPVPSEPNTPFRQALALAGSIEGNDLPLVVLSHGDGGWMGGHAHTALALAEAGYVAVAIKHPGNNSEDETAPPEEWLVSRPGDVSLVVDYMLETWPGSEHIHPSKIGVFGFSAGGYTALAVGGAAPDFSLAMAHCESLPEEYACRIGLMDGLDPEHMTQAVRDVAPDKRIGAISAAAPALGFAFPEAELAAADIPVQIWSGGSDDRVPHDTNGAILEERLPVTADVQDAGHFAFMAQCNPHLEAANPRVWKMVCVDAAGFDRASFHRHFNRAVIEFFDDAFGR